MNKRFACQMAAAFIFGVAAASFPGGYIGAAALAFAVLCFWQNKRSKKIRWLILQLLLFGFGIIRMEQSQEQQAAYAPLLSEGQNACVQGEIYQKEFKEFSNQFYLKHALVQIRQKNYSCNQIIVNLNADSYSIGETICVKGKIKPLQHARNEGNFDEASYYKGLKIDFRLEGEQVLFADNTPNLLYEGLFWLKERVKMSYQKLLSEKEAGICTAMVLGDKSVLDQVIKELYQRAGISHVLAISGLHISIIGMAFYLLLRKCGLSFFVAGILAGAGILCYGKLSGFGISEKRAILMFLMILYARFRGRAYDLPTALSAVAAVMLYDNPYLLNNAGFLLSFSAVAGIALYQSSISDRINESQEADASKTNAAKTDIVKADTTKVDAVKKGRRYKLLETLGVSLSIQLMTIPLSLYFFYQMPLYSMVINLFVLPLVGILLGCALAGGVLGCISPMLGGIVLIPCQIILGIFEKLCNFFVSLPGANLIIGQPSEMRIFIWYLLAACIFLFFPSRNKVGKICIFISAAAGFLWLLAIPKSTAFEMTVLDVGQGDGIYIHSAQGADLFIDGGSTSVSKVGTYRILPFLKSRGISRMDYWFVSHADEDHINGLEEILASGYPVEHLVVAQRLIEDEAFQNLKKAARENGTKIIRMEQGEAFRGKGEKAFEIRCLFPDEQYKNPDRNARSMVLLYQEDTFSTLLTGDISVKEEERMAAQQKLPRITVYKAAHHGSKGSNSAAFLEALHPAISVISCGENNRYGHPGKEAVDHMEDAGSSVYDTRYSGEIQIDISGKVTEYISEPGRLQN